MRVRNGMEEMEQWSKMQSRNRKNLGRPRMRDLQNAKKNKNAKIYLMKDVPKMNT